MLAELLEWRYCAECAQDRPFETPECVDGRGNHGSDATDNAPDLACTTCGAALVFARQPTRGGHSAARAA